MKKHRRKFNPAFKQEAVDLVRRTGKSSNQVAQELGIAQTSLSRWMRAAQASRGEDNVFARHEELVQLRKEVAGLKMERDILKKATAFFAKQST